MAFVTPREGENPESLVNRFRASVQHSGILREPEGPPVLPVQGAERALGRPARRPPAPQATPPLVSGSLPALISQNGWQVSSPAYLPLAKQATILICFTIVPAFLPHHNGVLTSAPNHDPPRTSPDSSQIATIVGRPTHLCSSLAAPLIPAINTPAKPMMLLGARSVLLRQVYRPLDEGPDQRTPRLDLIVLQGPGVKVGVEEPGFAYGNPQVAGAVVRRAILHYQLPSGVDQLPVRSAVPAPLFADGGYGVGEGPHNFSDAWRTSPASNSRSDASRKAKAVSRCSSAAIMYFLLPVGRTLCWVITLRRRPTLRRPRHSLRSDECGVQGDQLALFCPAYPNIEINTPATTAEPMTPDTLGPIAWGRRKLVGSASWPMV